MTSNEILNEWIAEINTTNNFGEMRRRSEELKLTKSPDERRRFAESSLRISSTDAIQDLKSNPDSPYLFREYLKQYGVTMDGEIPDDPYAEGYAASKDGWHQDAYRWRGYKERLGDYCGRHILNILGCGHKGSVSIDPHKEWNYLGGQYSIKGLIGPCSQWQGHTGYCWEGTYIDDRVRGY